MCAAQGQEEVCVTGSGSPQTGPLRTAPLTSAVMREGQRCPLGKLSGHHGQVFYQGLAVGTQLASEWSPFLPSPTCVKLILKDREGIALVVCCSCDSFVWIGDEAIVIWEIFS